MWVDLGPDDTKNIKVILDIFGDPNECTEFTYGFTYGGRTRKRVPEPHHPP
jgi:hypothetical protein